MAFEKVRAFQYICDTKEDLKKIPEKKMGVECFVIKEACEYKLMSDGEWIKQIPVGSGTGGDIDLSDYATEQYVDNAIANIKFPETDLSGYATEEFVKGEIAALPDQPDLTPYAKKEDVAKAIAEIDIPSTEGLASEKFVSDAIAAIEIPSVEGLASEKYVDEAVAAITIPSIDHLSTKEEVEAFKAELKACYRPVKYEITDVPVGTIVDYRDKEIRIFCPESVKFEKQNVGPTDDANMYYMTFITYAPEGAVALREGDKGVILDELISLENGTGCGIDKFGRKYKKHWFALASYDNNTSSWTYFGKTSTVNKYIGWTYVVAWYDKDNRMIDTDILRINLSNKNCHLVLENSYVDEESTVWAELPE